MFQNLIVEEHGDIRDVTMDAWMAAITRLASAEQRLYDTVNPLLRAWFEVLMTPLGSKIDEQWWYFHARVGAENGYNVDKNMFEQDLSLITSELILRARVVSAKALAIVLSVWPVAVR